MTFARVLAAAVFAVLLPAATAAAQPASDAARYPATTSLDLGATTLFVQADREQPLAGLQLFVAAGLSRESFADNGLAALTAECLLGTPIATRSERCRCATRSRPTA